MKPTTPTIKICFCALLFTFFISCQSVPEDANPVSHAGQMFVKAVPFKTADGWGYEIYADNKLYIRQAIIPGLQGRHSFASRNDALRTAQLAIKKMAAIHAMPSISKNDLQQLHIQMPD